MLLSKNIYFTSDQHFFHEKVIGFDSRPFTDIKHMHRVLINNYNSTVNDEDICYFLGDVGFGRGDELVGIISQLRGTKILIRGNHDVSGEKLYKAGFVAILNTATIYIGQQRLTMSHCPLRGIVREGAERNVKHGDCWHGESKHKQFSLVNEGQFHLHGHLHKPKGEHILDKQMDVGVRANDYRPVSISVIESWIARTLQNE